MGQIPANSPQLAHPTRIGASNLHSSSGLTGGRSGVSIAPEGQPSYRGCSWHLCEEDAFVADFLRLPVSPDPCQAPSLRLITSSSCWVAPNCLCVVVAISNGFGTYSLLSVIPTCLRLRTTKGRDQTRGVNFEGHVPQLGSKQIVGFQNEYFYHLHHKATEFHFFF